MTAAPREAGAVEVEVVDLPCPWCGSARGFACGEGSTYRWKAVECIECGAGPGEIREQADARVAWNTRAALAAGVGGDAWLPVAEFEYVKGSPIRDILCYCHYEDEGPQQLILANYEVLDFKQVTHYRELPSAPGSAGVA